MNNNWEVEMFTKKFKNLSEEETMFIKEASQAPGVVNNTIKQSDGTIISVPIFVMADKYKVLSSFYLAKQIEASSKSSDRHSRAIEWLTGVLVIVGIASVIVQLPFFK